MVSVPLWILIIVCSAASIYIAVGGILILKKRKMDWQFNFSVMRLMGSRSSPRGPPPELSPRGILRLGVCYLFLGLLFPVSATGLALSFAIEKQIVQYFILPYIVLFIATIILLPPILLKQKPL